MTKLLRAAGLALLLALSCAPAWATSVCSVAVTTAVTASIQTAVAGFGKPQAVTIQARFTYVASSATSVALYVQTTVDGTNWVDIAEFDFTTATAQKIVNVSGMTAVTTPTAVTDGSLSSNTTQAGVLGAQYRCKITSVGTYGAGTTVAVDILTR